MHCESYCSIMNIRSVASCWFLSLHATFMMQGHTSQKIIKPSLIAACNGVLGQSAASKMKNILLSNGAVERRISDTAEDTETQLIGKIKKSKLIICITTG